MLTWIVQYMDRFLVHKRYQIDRKFLISSANKIFKELNVKPIPIVFDDHYSCYYDSNEKYIGIGFGFFKMDWNLVFDYVDGSFEDRNDKLFFVIAHEIAHHLQFTKYPKWTKKVTSSFSYINARNGFSNPERYRELKLEANADKIALIISKKHGHAIDKY